MWSRTARAWGRICKIIWSSTSRWQQASQSRFTNTGTFCPKHGSGRSGCSPRPDWARPTSLKVRLSCAVKDGVEYPDIQYHFLPIAVRYDGQAAAEGHGFQAHTGPMRSVSRGAVTLRSSDPADDPENPVQLHVRPFRLGGFPAVYPAHRVRSLPKRHLNHL